MCGYMVLNFILELTIHSKQLFILGWITGKVQERGTHNKTSPKTCTIDWRETRQCDLKVTEGCGRKTSERDWNDSVTLLNGIKMSLLSYIFTKPGQYATHAHSNRASEELVEKGNGTITLWSLYRVVKSLKWFWFESIHFIWICPRIFLVMKSLFFHTTVNYFSLKEFSSFFLHIRPDQSYLPPLRRTYRPFVADNSPLLHWTAVLLPEHTQ